MSIIASIINGDHDNDLESISNAVHERRKITRQTDTAIAMVNIKVGDTVILKNLSPKYVNGAEAEVVDKKRTKLVVKLKEPIGKFGTLPMKVPASCVDKKV